MATIWTARSISEVMRSYQGACVLLAAAELDLFSLLSRQALTAAEVVSSLGSDLRATSILIDALCAMELLEKHDGKYSAAPGTADVLASFGKSSMLAMAQHQANCLRNWAQLASIVKTGKPAYREPSVRGEAADYASFIEAMDNIARTIAPQLIAQLPEIQFTHLLDVGGASGTWTIAFLQRYPNAKATLFDLAKVIPQASARLISANLLARVRLVGGDFLIDPLPSGTDLAWVSAIIHQMSRAENRTLYSSIFAALNPGGQILIRDHVMDATRTKPVSGALFAVNMLTATEAGGTYTFDEIADDLKSCGFESAEMIRMEDTMYCVVRARKPE